MRDLLVLTVVCQQHKLPVMVQIDDCEFSVLTVTCLFWAYATKNKHNSSNSAGTSSVASKYEELECLYAAVGKVIYEGLTNYEKATNANPSQLFGKLSFPHLQQIYVECLFRSQKTNIMSFCFP